MSLPKIFRTIRMVNYLKKIVTCLLIWAIVLSTYSFSSAGETEELGELELFGQGAVLVDYDSLEILYEKNPHKKLFPASTTKIMTGILAIENGNLEDLVTIDQEIVDRADGSHIALEPGEELTLAQLLDALLIESANDAAIAIAKHISGDVDSFVKLMNEKAHSLGAINTTFKNPDGLPDEEHLTTAYDLAIIGKYAMDNETFKNIAKNHTGTIPITNKKSEARHLNSSNRMLYSDQKILVDGESVSIKYEGVNGVKAGYTNAAQYCLVTSLERDGQRFIVVSLKADRNSIYSDTHKLLNYGLNNFKRSQVSFAGKFIDNFQIENGVTSMVPGITKSASFAMIKPDDISKIEEKVVLKEGLKAPLPRDEVIGHVEYRLDGKVLAKSDLVAAMDIYAVRKASLFSKILSRWYLILLAILFILRCIVLHNRKKRIRRRRIKSLSRNQIY